MKTIEIELTALAYGGDALGRLPDGRAVFVPFALPGERVRARIVEEKRGFARADLIQVLNPSPLRVEPRCPHFRQCGGCHYQHLPYAEQLKVKQDILRDQLARIGGIQDPPVRPIVPAPEPWNYRNHVQFHLTVEGKLGFQAAGSEVTVPVRECHLPEPALNECWPALDFEPDSGLERVGLRLGADGAIMLTLESDDEPPALESEADLSIVHLRGEHAVVLAGEEFLTMRALGREFRVSAGSFFQVNTPVAEAMVRHVLGLLPASIATALDVYCGVGLFSAFLAPRCERLIGVESAASACKDFAINLDEFDNVELYEGLAGDVLPWLDVSPQVVVLDPPRAGLERQALDALVRMAPQQIVYVSCDPATLARDAARLLSAGFRLVQATPFDLFPQTFHIESVAVFEPAAGRSG